jgi:uncharacterized protein YndB with AHSA1/START domain
VTLLRIFPAELTDVWDACTNPERIPHWFLPVSGELREGGRYRLEGNAGGTVTRCDAPHGFAATWEFGDDTSWVELRLESEGDERTRFKLEHIAYVDERWAQFGPGAVGIGWEGALIGLYLYLTTRQAVDRVEMAKWTASDEGRRFLALSSGAWCEADMVHGSDPAEARAAADRTTAFYTGMPPADAGK